MLCRTYFQIPHWQGKATKSGLESCEGTCLHHRSPKCVRDMPSGKCEGTCLHHCAGGGSRRCWYSSSIAPPAEEWAPFDVPAPPPLALRLQGLHLRSQSLDLVVHRALVLFQGRHTGQQHLDAVSQDRTSRRRLRRRRRRSSEHGHHASAAGGLGGCGAAWGNAAGRGLCRGQRCCNTVMFGLPC